MRSIETEGKTVEQAIELGLFKLGLTREEAKIQVLEQGSLFGKAKVRVSDQTQSAEESALQGVVDAFAQSLGIDCNASITEKDNAYEIDFSGRDVGVVIGKRGDILNNIQFLLSQIINKGCKQGEYKRIIVNSANYREKRENALKDLALRMASRAIREQKSVKLEPMNAAERRIIHSTLADNKKITTKSEGEDPRRYLTIFPVKDGQNKEERKALFNESAFVLKSPILSRDNND